VGDAPSPRTDGPPAETGVQALASMIVTVGAGAIAYAWGGLVTALVALLLAAAAVTLTQTLLRARQVAVRLEGRRWVDVSGMSSEQAAKVLSALSTSGDALPMPTSEVLSELARARERCKGDDVALAIELEALRARWPRSPAILGELARAHHAAGRPALAAETYVAAIREGRRIGSFSWVLALLARDEPWSLELALSGEEWAALRALARARGDAVVAARIDEHRAAAAAPTRPRSEDM
jgi:uncharacterized membrane protein